MLSKYAMGNVQFDESKHARDDSGRFASKGGSGTPPSFRQRQLVEASPGRLLEEKWGRGRAAGLFQQGKSGVPGRGHDGGRAHPFTILTRNDKLMEDTREEYTGERGQQAQVDGYQRHAMTWQRPKGLKAKEHDAIRSTLVETIRVNRDPAVEQAIERRLVPDDVSRRLINRAYNLAAMRALHEFGVGKFDYAMGDELKREMLPMVPAMRYWQRRIGDRMRADERTKAKWQPYKEEFGEPYPDRRLDKRPGKGNQLRLRWPKSQSPHTEYIKATMPGELLKASAVYPGARASLQVADGILDDAAAARGRRSGPASAPARVRAVLPQAMRVLSRASQEREEMARLPARLRHRNSERVLRDPSRSLADLLG